jgi:hypothetical protein
MDKIPFQEANIRPAIPPPPQKKTSPSMIYHNRVHKSPPPVPVPFHMNPLQSFTRYLRLILTLAVCSHLDIPNGLFRSG